MTRRSGSRSELKTSAAPATGEQGIGLAIRDRRPACGGARRADHREDGGALASSQTTEDETIPKALPQARDTATLPTPLDECPKLPKPQSSTRARSCSETLSSPPNAWKIAVTSSSAARAAAGTPVRIRHAYCDRTGSRSQVEHLLSVLQLSACDSGFDDRYKPPVDLVGIDIRDAVPHTNLPCQPFSFACHRPRHFSAGRLLRGWRFHSVGRRG